MTSSKAFRPPTAAVDGTTSLLGSLKKIRQFDLPAFKQLIRETLVELIADGTIECRPYVYSVKGACEAFALSESDLRRQIRAGRIAVRYAGAKVLIIGDSIRAFIDSLPAERQVLRADVAANRHRGVA